MRAGRRNGRRNGAVRHTASNRTTHTQREEGLAAAPISRAAYPERSQLACMPGVLPCNSTRTRTLVLFCQLLSARAGLPHSSGYASSIGRR